MVQLSELEPGKSRLEIANNLPRLRVYEDEPVVGKLLESVRTDSQGGEKFRQQLRKLAFHLGSFWAEGHSGTEPPLIIDIPRGGVPLGEGLKSLFPGALYFHTNDGENRDPKRSLLPENFPGGTINLILLADAVVGTGATIQRTIAAIEARAQVGEIVLFNAVTSQHGIEVLLQDHPRLRIRTATVEQRYQWVDSNGKRVFFVADIGDVGELVSRP